MRAVVWLGECHVEVRHGVPVPEIELGHDAVVRVVRTAICGTDLHAYRGDMQGIPVGTVLGHEFTGVIVDRGPNVNCLEVGDRVVASDIVACGACWFCRRGHHYQCREVTLFGYGTVVGSSLPGGQADFVRVPHADVVLSRIPDGISDEQALFAGDVLATGYASVSEAGTTPGDVVAIVGGGPVGLCAALSARLFGVQHVLVIDPDTRRRDFAESLGVTAAPPASALVHARHLTSGRGADIVVEAVGTDGALSLSLDLVRARGTVVAVGAHHSTAMPFSTGAAFAKEITLRFVVGDPISTRAELLGLIADRRLDATPIISHRLPLDEAAAGYRMFADRDATKVVLIP
jgi:2-desacetyl-2-hydroxyethyl bacteriochlorophyllide A dehydrogenase